MGNTDIQLSPSVYSSSMSWECRARPLPHPCLPRHNERSVWIVVTRSAGLPERHLCASDSIRRAGEGKAGSRLSRDDEVVEVGASYLEKFFPARQEKRQSWPPRTGASHNPTLTPVNQASGGSKDAGSGRRSGIELFGTTNLAQRMRTGP